MSSKKWETKKIAIKDLILWDENSRIPDYLLEGNQEEVIQILLKKYNLVAFANEIVKDFDMPQLEKIVVWSTKGKNVPLEGNRRLAAYMCLDNPSLVKDNNLREKFEVLRKKISINNTFELEAIVNKNKEEGMRYVDRKHYYGNNEERWQQYERDHHIKRTRDVSKEGLSVKERDSIFRANLADKVKLISLPDEIKQKVLSKGLASTFYRVVGSIYGRKKLKYERLDYELVIENEREFLTLLKIMAYNIYHKRTLDGSKKLNSRTLNLGNNIKEYLDTISIEDVKEIDELLLVSKKIKESKKNTSITAKKIIKSKKAIFFSLINPKESLPPIESEKIKEVYKELQIIKLSECPTACSILVRILIEVTVEEFLKSKGDLKSDLLIKRINYIKSKYVKDKHLVKLIEILNDDLLTKKLNQVAHNRVFSATGTSIKDLWKNLKMFFYFLIEGVKIKSD